MMKFNLFGSIELKPRAIQGALILSGLISKTQLYCELQRDWNRTKTVPGFMDVFKNWGASDPERDLRAT